MSNKKKKSSKKVKFRFFKFIGKEINRFCRFLYSIFDKLLITPLAKLMLFASKVFHTDSKPLDRLLNNKSFLIVLSLIISAAAFYFVNTKTELMINNSADVLYNQKVKALYNEEAYVVEDLPSEVNVMMIGRKSDLYLAKQHSRKDVVVDLRNLKPGSHKVSLKYDGDVDSVDYKVDPSSTTVTIYEKMSQANSISKEVLYENKLDSKFTITDISFSRDEVYVKGAQYKLDKVATVKALVDISKIVSPNVGTTTLKDIPLVAYDANGSKLDVEIVPRSVDATITIASPSKEVSLRAIPEGDVVFGKAIDNIALSTTKVTIYGSEEVLADISYLPVKIDVSGINTTTDYNVNLSKPTGVRAISTPKVSAKVTLGDIHEKTITGVGIATRNLSSGYTAHAASKTDSSLSVIVKGTEGNLKNITSDNISAYVDLQGLSEGSHDIAVNVTGADLKLTYKPQKATITIVIKKS